MTDTPFDAMASSPAEYAARLLELTKARRSTTRAPAAVAGFDAMAASPAEYEKALKEITRRPTNHHHRINGAR